MSVASVKISPPTAHNAHARNRRSGTLCGGFKNRHALHMVRHRKDVSSGEFRKGAGQSPIHGPLYCLRASGASNERHDKQPMPLFGRRQDQAAPTRSRGGSPAWPGRAWARDGSAPAPAGRRTGSDVAGPAPGQGHGTVARRPLGTPLSTVSQLLPPGAGVFRTRFVGGRAQQPALLHPPRLRRQLQPEAVLNPVHRIRGPPARPSLQTPPAPKLREPPPTTANVRRTDARSARGSPREKSETRTA